ncbi:MAG: cupin-like domain-containing protein [Candidatus Binatia bacterium]
MRSYPGMRRIPLSFRARYNAGFCLEHFFPESERVRAFTAAARARIVDHVRSSGKGRSIPVARATSLAPADFRRHFLSKGIPVLIEGAAASWPLMERWSFAEFDRRFGHETIKLVQRKGAAAPEEVVEGREFSEEIGFSAFLEQIFNGGRKYMRFSPLFEQFPELLADFDHSYFQQMVRNRLGMSFQCFIGGRGTFTPLHNAITPFFFLNACGTKRWTLVPNQYLAVLNPSPDGFGYNHSAADLDFSNVDAFPGLDCIERLEVVLQPGDLLFVPPWMWHCVQNDSPTIGVRCGFMAPRAMLTESMTLAFIRIFAARNPTTLEWLYYSLFKTNLPERDRLLTTPKWHLRTTRDQK